MAHNNEDKVCVGAIAGAFGVTGEVRLKSFCAEPEAIADYGALTSEDGKRQFNITISRPIKSGFAAQIQNVKDKEAADALRGVRLYADRSALPDLPDDEYYHADLIGLTVLDTGGVELGRVKNVLNHGASDLLEITSPNLREPALLPFTLEAVPTVDLKSRRIIADPPEGVFPDPDAKK